MAATEPPPAVPLPPLSFPVAGARSVCPNCGLPFTFSARPAEPNDGGGQLLLCVCKTVLGQYVLRQKRMIWLRLAGPD